MRSRVVVALAASLLVGCSALGIRGNQASADRRAAQHRAAIARHRADIAEAQDAIRRACNRETRARLTDLAKEHAQAERVLNAAEERLRVAQDLGDAATIYQAMKDRDSVREIHIVTAPPPDEDQTRWHAECQARRRQAARAASAQAEAREAERRRLAVERQRLESERRREVLQAIGEGLRKGSEPRTIHTDCTRFGQNVSCTTR